MVRGGVTTDHCPQEHNSMTSESVLPRRASRACPNRRVLALAAAALAAPLAMAQSPANVACPYYFVGAENLAANPNLDEPDPRVNLGAQFCWRAGEPPMLHSAAAGWSMHTNNVGAKICTRLKPGSAPGPGGTHMVHVKAWGNEGGIYQDVVTDPTKSYMFSVWVYTRAGQVAIQSNSFVGGPVAFTTKTNEWEQLRVCTNGITSTNQLVIYNQAPEYGEFFVDRVELREIP
jgi:hypothetical protein